MSAAHRLNEKKKKSVYKNEGRDKEREKKKKLWRHRECEKKPIKRRKKKDAHMCPIS